MRGWIVLGKGLFNSRNGNAHVMRGGQVSQRFIQGFRGQSARATRGIGFFSNFQIRVNILDFDSFGGSDLLRGVILGFLIGGANFWALRAWIINSRRVGRGTDILHRNGIGQVEGEVKVIQAKNKALKQNGKVFPFFLSLSYIFNISIHKMQ